MLYQVFDMSYSNTALKLPKYQHVLESIKNDILGGRYQPGQKLPSEAAFVKRFGTSRITVGRALRELRQAGLVKSHAGSGNFVDTASSSDEGTVVRIADSEPWGYRDIGPICQGMSEAPQARKNALLWGNSVSDARTKDEQALQLCQQYISKKVAGVFFAPLERITGSDQANHRVISELERARIPVVLLDRCILPYPRRTAHDLIAIDHRRAGYIVTEHLLKLGCRRIAFVAYSKSAATVSARIDGYLHALFASGAPAEMNWIKHLNSELESEVRQVMETLKPEAIVCANDRIAAHLMHSLIRLSYRIPDDIRIVGIDDVEYANLLPIPLTTVHQPCREIGVAAMAAMLERVTNPDMPVRDILLDCKLVIRDSCGANMPL